MVIINQHYFLMEKYNNNWKSRSQHIDKNIIFLLIAKNKHLAQ